MYINKIEMNNSDTFKQYNLPSPSITKMRTSTNSNSNNKYIPPNKPSLKTFKVPASTSTSNSLNLTKKSAPQKVFSLTPAEFPGLATPKTSCVQPSKSFANAAKTVLPRVGQAPSTNEVPPGWVHIRKRNGRIEYKEGPPSNRYPVYDDNDDYLINEWLFNHRVAQLQYERDIDVLCRGDLSEYYGLPTVYEQYLDDFAQDNQQINTHISSDSSDCE